jgi:hypothetical protein
MDYEGDKVIQKTTTDGLDKQSTRSGLTNRSTTSEGRRALLAAQNVEKSRRKVATERITRKHFVKIFIDDNEIAEVSEEQVARVKMSTYDRLV